MRKAYSLFTKAAVLTAVLASAMMASISSAGEMVYGDVRGKVVDSSGNFVKGAIVEVGERERREVFRKKEGYVTLQVGRKAGVTDRYGDFEIRNVVTGYQPISVKIGEKVRVKDMAMIGRGANEFNFTLPPEGKVSSNHFNGSVTGKVLDDRTRLPISGARVEINKLKTETDKDGNFYYQWVQPGYHFVYAFKEGYKDFVDRVHVDKGDNYYELLCEPEKGFSIISSRVIDGVTRQPLAGVLVDIDNKKVYTAENGAFQVMVEKGRHHVLTLTLGGYRDYSKYVFAKADMRLEDILLTQATDPRVSAGDIGILPGGNVERPMRRGTLEVEYRCPDCGKSDAGCTPDGCAGEAAKASKAPGGAGTSQESDLSKDLEPWSAKEEARPASGRDSDRSGRRPRRGIASGDPDKALPAELRSKGPLGASPSLTGPTGLLFLTDSRITPKGGVTAGGHFTRLAADGDSKELIYDASLNFGVTDLMEVGLSHRRFEDEVKGMTTRKEGDTFFNLKYQAWKGGRSQGVAVGTMISSDAIVPFATYGFDINRQKVRVGDMNLTVRKNIESNNSITEFGMGLRYSLDRHFELLAEGIRESMGDSHMYNLGLRYRGQPGMSVDLYASWLFDVQDASGLGAGLSWGF